MVTAFFNACYYPFNHSIIRNPKKFGTKKGQVSSLPQVILGKPLTLTILDKNLYKAGKGLEEITVFFIFHFIEKESEEREKKINFFIYYLIKKNKK